MMMRRLWNWKLGLAIVAVLALVVPVALAQGGMGQGKGMQGKGMPKYDPATETTLKGMIEEVKEQECQMCRMGTTGTHLMVKSDSETMEIHLGPTSFLNEKKFSFAKGDQIEVVGSKVKFNGGDAVIAREVKKGDQTLTLRNAQGIPQWARGGRSRN